MKKAVLTACIAFLAFVLSAEDITIRYKTGAVQVIQAGVAKEAFEGDSVDEAARIEVGPASLLELKRGNETIRLSRQGTYWISGLVKEKTGSSKGNVADLIFGKITKVFTGSGERRNSVAGGVRAERMERPKQLWMEGGSSELIEAGKTAFAEKRREDAAKLFHAAREAAEEPEEAAEAAFQEAFTLTLLGKNEAALLALEAKPAPRSGPTYAAAQLLRARLLIAASAYDETLAALRSADLKVFDPESAAAAGVLAGLASLGKNDTETAKAFFRRAAAQAPGTAAAGTAEDLLGMLPSKP